MPCATVTFWCIEIVFFPTPSTGRRMLPVSRPASHQPSCQARTPRVDHISANSCRYTAAFRGIAPSEWLTRYVQVSTIGNSERQCSMSPAEAMPRAGVNSTTSQLPIPNQRAESHEVGADGVDHVGANPRAPGALHIQIHPDTLHLGVMLERVRAHFPAEAARLVAAERRGGVVDVVGVDPDGARLELARDVMRLLDVAGPDRRRQSVWRFVGARDRLVDVGKLNRREYRPENLLP